ncbi:Oxidoreductase htatip2 [Mactra antiquata]
MAGVKSFILGYTGETGKALVKQLAQDGHFTKIVLIGRREVDLDAGIQETNKFEQKVINFDNIAEFKDSVSECDVGFCCLGTTRRKGGVDHFIKVDRDYVVNSARVAKEVGCKHFQVVTAYGANKNSFFTYNKTKGEVEELLKGLEFDRLSIFRPGLLLGKRVEKRPLERFLSVMLTPLVKLSPKDSSVHFDILAKAMINNVTAEKPHDPVETIDNKTIHSIANQDAN